MVGFFDLALGQPTFFFCEGLAKPKTCNSPEEIVVRHSGMDKKPKVSVGSVRGKVIVQNQSGEKISQWGGTECFLSREDGIGYCFVVKSSRHKRGQGTFFRLSGLRQVLSLCTHDGKLTLMLPHEQVSICTVFVTSNDDIPQLQAMADILQDRSRWPSAIEVNLSAVSVKVKQSDVSESLIAADQVRDVPQIGASSLPDLSGATRGALTTEQQRAFKFVEQGESVFITGKAGSGKSQWIRHVLSRYPDRDATVVTATTGLAARQFGGSTVHSFAGIGLGQGSFEQIVERVRSRPEVVRSWQRCRMWIIDEVGMLPKDTFDLLDKVARAMKKKPHEPFGGIQMILVGDFLQLPPVTRRGEELTFCFQASAWRSLGLRSCEFSQDFRHANDVEFAQCMDDIRGGQLTPAGMELLSSCLNRKFDNSNGVEATHIMSLHKDVDAFNETQLGLLPETFFQRYHAEDSVTTASITLNNEVSFPEVLTLKKGAQVVLLARLPNSELQNGDRGVVTGFSPQASGQHLPIVLFEKMGEELVVSPARVDVTSRGVAIASRVQLPLCLAWALTVHRVQGMTLPSVVIRLDRSFFEFGQAYVALSRVRKREDLSLLAFDRSAIKAPAPCIDFYANLFPSFRAERAARQVLLSGGEPKEKRHRVEAPRTHLDVL